MSWKLRFCLLLLAIDAAAIIVLETGLIGGWGQWYGTSAPYRRQTDAFFDGRFSLSDDPRDISFDMVWANNAVQQVWGLGVPIWRFPFEVVARVFGLPAFPDRIALAIAIATSAYWILKAFTLPPGVLQTRTWIDSLLRNPRAIVAVLILIFFPHALMLCRGPMNVYEEPVLYSYYLSVGLLAAAFSFNQRPTFSAYVAISLFAGVTGFVRPTSLAYGGATMVTVSICAASARWRRRRLLIGPILFLFGCVLLAITNWIRFGAMGEFGHNLNLTGMDMLIFSRFGAPYSSEPYWPATKELFSALFAVERFNDLADAYAADILQWQSPTPRWRHFYQSTFDVSHFLILCTVAVLATLRSHRAFYGGLVALRASGTIAAIWATASAATLCMFYLRFHCISSRYVMDFAPAFAGASATIVLWCQSSIQISGEGRRSFLRLGSTSLIAAWLFWWEYQLLNCRNYYPASPTLARESALQVPSDRDCDTESALIFPSSYNYIELDENQPLRQQLMGIPFNGYGWLPNGHTKSVVVLFIDALSTLEVHVAMSDNVDLRNSQWNAIRAKIGANPLRRTSISHDESEATIVFQRGATDRQHSGIQVLFICFDSIDKFKNGMPPDVGLSPFLLKRVCWRK